MSKGLTPYEIETRRRFLRNLSLGGATVFLLASLPGCAEEKEILAGKPDELDKQGYLQFTFNGNQVFVTRRNEQLVAFSLMCTHKRCTVKWKSEEQKFRCPCHKGIYDADGKRLSGPPPGPLGRFKTEMRNGEIWVLNEPA